MAFTCPNCHGRKSLKITQAIDLPPDCRSDEITVQVVTCEACNFQGAAVYEESRRGASERAHHVGYKVEIRTLRSLAETIKKCPERRNPHCICPTHRALAWTDDGGRWEGMGVSVKGIFEMRLG